MCMCLSCMCTGTSTMYIYMYMENTSWRMQYGTQQHMSYHSYDTHLGECSTEHNNTCLTTLM